jgi:hypothetical protein
MQSENGMPEVKTKPNDAADPWGDLVVSILSVNRYSLERTYSFCDHLRQNGLLDPSQLASLEPGEIANKLVSAGYNRGAFMTNLFASRLSSLGAHVEHRGVMVCTEIISSTDRRTIQEFLLQVNGIGSKVIENFFFLRGI